MRPSSTRTATCDCRTMSCAPFLISLFGREKRHAIVSSVSSTHSMTSISSPVRNSRSVMGNWEGGSRVLFEQRLEHEAERRRDGVVALGLEVVDVHADVARQRDSRERSDVGMRTRLESEGRQLRRAALRLGGAHAIEAAVADEVEDAAELVTLEPHAVALAHA